MDDKFEKTLKEFLPYIIVCGILFLLLPLFMGKDASVVTYIIQIGAFPLTAFGCGFFYKLKNKRINLLLCLIAPLFYALTALLYGMWRNSWFTVLIYLAAYFLCGYLGMIVADFLPKNKKTAPAGRAIRKQSQSPRRVNVEEENAVDEDFRAEDPDDPVLNASTTDDDIEAILKSIQNRKSQ